MRRIQCHHLVAFTDQEVFPERTLVGLFPEGPEIIDGCILDAVVVEVDFWRTCHLAAQVPGIARQAE